MPVYRANNGLLNLIATENTRNQDQIMRGSALLANTFGNINAQQQQQQQNTTSNALAKEKFEATQKQNAATAAAAAQKQQREDSLYGVKMGGRIAYQIESLPQEQRGEAYQQGLVKLDELGIDTTGLPKYYDQSVTKQAIALSQSVKDRIISGQKPPATRNITQGGEEITQQWNQGTRSFDEIGRGPRWNPKSGGLQLAVGADGEVRFSTGGQALTKTTQSKIETKLLDANEAMSRVMAIEDTLDP